MEFNLDMNGERHPLTKYWNFCIGSCHAATALRSDWQKQLARCRRELGFRYVRFHGLFDDDMSVAVRPMLAKEIKLCFTNIDRIYDFLLSIGMKPFVELGFMPTALASGDSTVFHYKGNTTPPADYRQWEWLIREFIKHLLERYGRDEVRSWFFEVWNEPNLGGPGSPAGFWASTKEEYFHLYEVTVRAVKEEDCHLPVGGPATSNNAWITEFLKFCQNENVPVDFVSTHHYPTDVVLGYGVEDSANFTNPVDLSNPDKMKTLMERITDNPAELEKVKQEYMVFQSHLWEKVDRGVLTGMAARARKEAGELPLYYTEWSSLAGLESDGPFGASFIGKTVMDNMGLVQGYSYWTFSDIFEESGQPAPAFHGGFGLMNQQGIPKAAYRVYQLLNKLEGEIYNQEMREETVDLYAVKEEERHLLRVLAVNHQSLLHSINAQTIKLTLCNAPVCTAAEIHIVDNSHGNALAQWKQMGAPVYLTEKDRLLLEASSELTADKLITTLSREGLQTEFVLEPMACALLTFYF